MQNNTLSLGEGDDLRFKKIIFLLSASQQVLKYTGELMLTIQGFGLVVSEKRSSGPLEEGEIATKTQAYSR